MRWGHKLCEGWEYKRRGFQGGDPGAGAPGSIHYLSSIIVEKEDNFQLLFELNDIVLSIGEEVTVLSINLFQAHLFCSH